MFDVTADQPSPTSRLTVQELVPEEVARLWLKRFEQAQAAGEPFEPVLQGLSRYATCDGGCAQPAGQATGAMALYEQSLSLFCQIGKRL